MQKLRRAAEWMWDHRGQNIWWRPAVLTPINPDTTNPGLNIVEAESVFRMLEDQKLIFPVLNPQDQQTAYLINEIKESEWKVFIRALTPFHRYFLKPLILIFTKLWVVVVWLISVAAAAAIGGFFSAWMQSLFKK